MILLVKIYLRFRAILFVLVALLYVCFLLYGCQNRLSEFVFFHFGMFYEKF